MIGKLRGVVDGLDEEELILDVNGVGYLVAASARTLRALPPRGQPAELLIETHVREDAIKLYGFLTAAERDWFRLLQSVQGVGAKVALGILGALTADALSTRDRPAGQGDDGARPRRRPEARRPSRARAEGQGAGARRGGSRRRGLGAESGLKLPKAAEDAILALVGLGYARAQAATAIARCSAALGAEAGTAALIRAGLKELAQ